MALLNFEMYIISVFLFSLFVNVAFLIILCMLFCKSAKRRRLECNWYMKVAFEMMRPGVFKENCQHFGLTKAEIVIVQMLYQGLSNKEIAGKIFISQETVKKHLQNIFCKTNVGSRMELVHVLQKSIKKSYLPK